MSSSQESTPKRRGRPPTYKTAEDKLQAKREINRRYRETEKGKVAYARFHEVRKNKIKRMKIIEALEIASLEAKATQLSNEELIRMLEKITV
jgi:hypothetical protein